VSSGHGPSFRVDSPEELEALIITRGAGRIVARREISDTLVDIEAERESGCISRFRVNGHFSVQNDPACRYGRPTTESLDILMSTAVSFSADNPPHHPGSLARFPVPSERYPGRVEIPLAVLARDSLAAGLYAPPRVAVLDWWTAAPMGIGEFPGFHPESWPPPRLGDWPPVGSRKLSGRELSASVARLSACLGRLIDYSVHGGREPHAEDVTDVRVLLLRLEVPSMIDYYRKISPQFMDLLSL
jgi:hypothetical protein